MLAKSVEITHDYEIISKEIINKEIHNGKVKGEG